MTPANSGKPSHSRGGRGRGGSGGRPQGRTARTGGGGRRPPKPAQGAYGGGAPQRSKPQPRGPQMLKPIQPVRLSEAARRQAVAALQGYAEQLTIRTPPVGWAHFLVRYQEQILGQNQAVNLTTIVAPDEFMIRHLFDSLATVQSLPELREAPPLQILDVGTGAGFPGVPLWSVFPQHHYTLIDGTAKKVACVEAAFRAAMDECLLDGQWQTGGEAALELLGERAELLARSDPKRAQAYDVALARATGPGVEVFDNTIKLLKPGGKLVLYFTDHPARGEAELIRAMAKREIPCDPGTAFPIQHGEKSFQRRHCVITAI